MGDKEEKNEKESGQKSRVSGQASNKKKTDATKSTKKEEQKEKKKKIPDFRSGDTVKVWIKLKEKSKKGEEKIRLQGFQGIVISKKGRGISKTFTVRKIASGQIGVERIWPLYSPTIDRIEVVQKGKVRRAKLYYLREKVGKEAMKVKKANS